MTDSPLRVAIVGCGQIADAHLRELRKIEQARVVAVCDLYMDVALQAAARFDVPAVFADVEEMVRTAQPAVVHLTTPPQTHLPLAISLLAKGIHLYIEKPFTVTVAEADQLLEAAAKNNLKVCVGHDQLFDPAWLAARDLVSSGKLGRIAHVDSIQGYDLAGRFGAALAADPDHWVHRLPGGIFQNVMSHALYRITDLIPDDELEIQANWFRGEAEYTFPTELRAMLKGTTATANLIFTTAGRPVQRVTRIYGTLGGIDVDMESQLIRQFTSSRLPNALAKLQIPARQLKESMRLFAKNVGRFIHSDIHYTAGMNRLFRDFYDSILHDRPTPISPAEIRRVTAIMDRIFEQCQANEKR